MPESRRAQRYPYEIRVQSLAVQRKSRQLVQRQRDLWLDRGKLEREDMFHAACPLAAVDPPATTI